IQTVSGYRPSDLLGHRSAALVAPEARLPFLHRFLKLRRRGAGATEEHDVTVMTSGGESTRLSVRVSVIEQDDGDVLFVGVARPAAARAPATAWRDGSSSVPAVGAAGGSSPTGRIVELPLHEISADTAQPEAELGDLGR